MRKTQPKRQRIPKRGPGVAELEKILKEQEGQDLPISPPPPPFLFHHHHSPSLNPPRPPPPPPPPPLPLPPPNYPSSNHWPNLPLFPNLELTSPTMPTADAAAPAGRPEKALFPTTPKSDTQIIYPPHFYPNFQSSPSTLNLEYFNSMVNFIPGSASATSSAGRLFHQIEHPSSQRSTNYNNMWTSPSPEEQEKMVSAKRLRPLSDESHRDPNFQSRAPMVTNMTMKESSSSSSSSLEMNRTAFNLDPNLSGTKRGFAGQLMSSTKSSGSYQLAEDSNLMALGSSSSTPNEFAPFHFHLPQEIMEGSQQRAGGGSGSAASDNNNKITLNSSLFYESNVQSKSKDSKEDGIDLDLKL